jgi:hypothetical protein
MQDEEREAFLKDAAARCLEAIKAAKAARAIDRDQKAYRVAIRRATIAYHAALSEASR